MGQSQDINNKEVEIYSALSIANEIIKLSNYSINLRKLEKMMFLAQGWCLKLSNNSLISQPFYTWGYGPIEITTYEAFKNNGERSISNLAADYSGNEFKINNEVTLEFLKTIYETYVNPGSILNKLHCSNSAWNEVFFNEGIHKLIPNEIIRKKFIA